MKQEGIAVGDRSGASGGGAAIGVANLGLDLMSAGRLDEAEAAMRDALRRMDALPVAPPERSGVLNNLSHVLRTRGNYAEAEQFGAQAAEAALQIWGARHFRRAAFATTWGRALAGTGDLDRARAVLEEALATYRSVRPAGHVDLIGPLLGLGTVHRLQGRLGEADRMLGEARAIAVRNPAVKERGAEVAGELGLTRRALGRTADADALLKESYDVLQAAFGDAHPLTSAALGRLRAVNQGSSPPAAR